MRKKIFDPVWRQILMSDQTQKSDGFHRDRLICHWAGAVQKQLLWSNKTLVTTWHERAQQWACLVKKTEKPTDYLRNGKQKKQTLLSFISPVSAKRKKWGFTVITSEKCALQYPADTYLEATKIALCDRPYLQNEYWSTMTFKYYCTSMLPT